MNLPKIAIQNTQFVFIVVLITVFAGFRSYQSMPKSEDPALSLPNYSVVAVYPGTTVEDMEELIVNPIEDELYALEDIETIRTRVEEGIMIMKIEGAFGVDIDDKYDEISNLITELESDLPEDIFSLEANKASPEDIAIVQLALVGERATYAQLEREAERLEQAIKPLPTVRDVELVACPEQEIHIELDLDKMALRNISLNQLISTLQSNNQNIPGGDVDAGAKSLSIQTTGSYKTLAELAQTVVGSFQDRVVLLGDIAQLEFDYEETKWAGRFNGVPAVFVNITQKKGENILTTTQALMKKLGELQAQTPANIRLELAFIQAPAVDARIYDFFMNLLQGILLVGLMVLLFLGARSALIVMTVIPISILMAIGALDVSGYGLQQISIAGLVIALGLLVDNGIVVIENIMRFKKAGLSPIAAAIKGTSEVGVAIVSSTMTTLLAFFPLTQLGGGTGEFLKTLPLIVIFALLASLLLALVLTPILSARILKDNADKKPSLVDRGLERLIERVYTPTLSFALKRSWVVLILVVMAFVGALRLFPAVGVSFFPTADKPLLLIDVELPLGSNLDETDQAIQFVESVLDTSAFVTSYLSNIGHGNSQVYYNRIPTNYKKNYGQLVVNLERWDPARFYRYLGFLRNTFNAYPEARITINELKNGPPFEAPIEIKVLGTDLDTLKRYTALVERAIAQTEGTTDLNNPYQFDKVLLKMEVNTTKAAILGVQRAAIDVAIRTAAEGWIVDAATFDDNKEYNLILKMPEQEATPVQLTDFRDIYVPSNNGSLVPLRHIAELQFSAGLHQIDHYNTVRATTVTANVFDADQTAAITTNVIERLETIKFPPGYDYYVGGEYETQQSSFGDLGISLAFALLAIFAVLVLQFNSLTQPLVVFSAIPFAFIGSILALYLTGWSFSFFAFVGFTSLVDIVVNNSIILVDYTNQLIQQGLPKFDAIVQACQTRFKPIVLTSLTTILGLLPLTLGKTNLWSPLGWTIIGGMLTSTFLVLLLVPILYNYFSGRSAGRAL